MPQCPKCKAEVSTEFRFCKQCGAALAAAAPSVQPASRPAEPVKVPAAAAAVPAAARVQAERENASRDVETTQPVSPPPTRTERERLSPPAARAGAAPRGKGRLAAVAVVGLLVIAGAGLYYYGGGALRGYLPFGGGSGKPSLKAEQHLNQGLTFASMKDYDNAIVEFGKAIEVDSRYAAAYANRGVAYIQQRKLNKALDDLKQAEGLNPKDKMIQYNLTALFSLQGQRDRALDALDRTLELGFGDYDALRKDPDLNNLRSDPEFRKVLEKHKVFLQ